jgi:NAD(P)H dehydrogenase (quinone)
MKKVLLILGHPSKKSFCKGILDSYKKGLEKTNCEYKELYLCDLNFNLNLGGNFEQANEIESDILLAQELLKWADHYVFVYPIWWGNIPALLKGFIDRAFLPGVTFKYQKNSPFPEKLLKGKTARLLVTMDSPNWWFKFVYRSSANHAMKEATLNFCGVSPVKITIMDKVRESTIEQRNLFLNKVENLGKNIA